MTLLDSGLDLFLKLRREIIEAIQMIVVEIALIYMIIIIVLERFDDVLKHFGCSTSPV